MCPSAALQSALTPPTNASAAQRRQGVHGFVELRPRAPSDADHGAKPAQRERNGVASAGDERGPVHSSLSFTQNREYSSR